MADAVEAAEPPRILVAGIGNIFLGDDGFGSAVAARLAGERLGADVSVVDYGIRGIHLAYALLEGCDLLVLIDAVRRGAAPGTVSVIAIDDRDVPDAGLDAHAMDPAAVLANVRRLGGALPRTLLVACEAADTGERMGLSPPVEAAVAVAAQAVRELVAAPDATGQPSAAGVRSGSG